MINIQYVFDCKHTYQDNKRHRPRELQMHMDVLKKWGCVNVNLASINILKLFIFYFSDYNGEE